MKTIKAHTKQGQRFTTSYNRATAASLAECYNRPSTEKTMADYFCRLQMIKDGGNGYKVISYNTFTFSVAWRVPQGLRIETSCNSYLVTE